LGHVETDGGPVDNEWIAQNSDKGFFLACPRCHFLHLPTVPFPLRPFEIERSGPPVDACDVCASLPLACGPSDWGGGWEQALPHAGDDLADERTMRAITLYRLWMGATNGADALRVAAIAEGLRGLVERSRTPGAADAE